MYLSRLIGQWTWIDGSSLTNVNPTHSNISWDFSPNNHPGSRESPSLWPLINGTTLYLFGGRAYNGSTNFLIIASIVLLKVL